MAVELSDISMPMAALLASLIGASATITAAILNLRMAWKRELVARAQHKPVTKKSSRAPLIPLVILLLASAAGGFALSYHLEDRERASTATLEAELRTKIEQLDIATRRLETLNLGGLTAAKSVDDAEHSKLDAERAVAAMVLGTCVATATGGSCEENTARPVQLCAEVPLGAVVVAIDLYARRHDEPLEWEESRVSMGDDFGGGRFVDRRTESLVDDAHKQVCQELQYSDGDHALDARMVVHYDTPPLAADREETLQSGRQRRYPSIDGALSQVP